MGDLEVLVRVRPLIQAGILVPLTLNEDICPHCIAVKAFGGNADTRFNTELSRLEARYLKELSVTIEFRNGEWVTGYEAPKELIEHGGMYDYSGDDMPPPLDQMPRLRARALAGESIKLSMSSVRKNGAHKYFARRVYDNVVFEMVTAQLMRTSYLSESELTLQVITAISGDEELAHRNEMVEKHLTTMVPFLENISPQIALKLRQREEAAFLLYRKALNEAIDSVRAEGASLGERDARAIYSDIIAPGLAELDRAVKGAKRDLIKNMTTSAGGWMGAIGFGMYTGLLPDQLVGAAQTLGLAKVAADLVKTGLQVPSGADVIKKEDLYFLWRLRRIGEQSKFD